MGYVLLWAEGLAAAVLCLALAAAWAASRGSVFRVAGVVVVFLGFAGLPIFAAHATAPWQRMWAEFLPADLFGYSLGWLLVYLVASIVLLRRAFQRPAAGLARRGAGWSRTKLGLGLGGAALAWGLTFWNLDLAARADLAVARQEAGDILLAMSPPAVADPDNAARLYGEAGNDLITPIRNPWHDAARRGLSAPPQEEADWKDPYIVELVARQENVLARLRKAAARPGGSQDPRLSLNDLSYDPELSHLRWEEVTLLGVDARVKAAQGEFGRAFGDIAAILGSTRHVPVFLAGPQVLGIQAMAWRTLEDVLRLAPAAKDPLPAVPFPEVISAIRALHREMAVMGMIWPVLLSDDPLRIPELRKGAGPWSQPPLVYATETIITPACRIFLTPPELTYSHQKWEAYRRILHARPEGTPQDWASLRNLIDTQPAGIFSALYIKPKEKRLLQDAGHLAALEPLARAGLAAARYRAKHGRYPEHLEQLVPEFLPAMPTDPRDGQALQIKGFAEVTVLYTQMSNPELANATEWSAGKYRDQPVFRLVH